MSTATGPKTVIGTPSNFWLFDNTHGFDITHPRSPDSAPIYPRLTLRTSNTRVTLAPGKTALVIIDMQNIFLSSAMGRKKGAGHAAEQALLTKCIPAARKANIRMLWLTWGISDEGLRRVPPLFYCNFALSFEHPGTREQGWRFTDNGGIGRSIGPVTLSNGTTINGGKLLMKDQWNTALHGDLSTTFTQGSQLTPPDVRFHKETHSGFWGRRQDRIR
jgi:nicotinamidase-related amidase